MSPQRQYARNPRLGDAVERLRHVHVVHDAHLTSNSSKENRFKSSLTVRYKVGSLNLLVDLRLVGRLG